MRASSSSRHVAEVRPGSRFVAERPACRAEDGIYLADGRVVLLEVVDDVVHVHETTTLGALCEEAPDDWSGLEASVRTTVGSFVASGGGTEWEAEGWVALQAVTDDRLLWLVKLEGVEPVTAVGREGDAIVARSDAYPFVVEWRIPIADPQQIVIERRRADDFAFAATPEP